MRKNKLVFLTLFTLILILLLHLFGMSEHLYINFWFYDIIMHILGGIGIALSSFYILKDSKYIIITTIIAGILWEIFEIYFDLSGSAIGSLPHKLDTIKDIFNDTIGAIIVWITIKSAK